MHIVYETLNQLGVVNKKIITLFNKQDKRRDDEPLSDFRADHILNISAARGEGLDSFKELLGQLLRENKVYVERVISYDRAGIIQQIRKQGVLLAEEYVPEGISVKAYVPMEIYGRL